jgi:hypothetical protein
MSEVARIPPVPPGVWGMIGADQRPLTTTVMTAAEA